MYVHYCGKGYHQQSGKQKLSGQWFTMGFYNFKIVAMGFYNFKIVSMGFYNFKNGYFKQ
jgi:hypothetical protein